MRFGPRTVVHMSALVHASCAFTLPARTWKLHRRLATGASTGGVPTTYTLKERNPFDCHVYYRLDDGSKEEALALREAMKAAFPWMRFHRPFDRPIGPHPLPMWEADFATYDNRHQWPEVVRWIEANHGSLSVLVHPHSTDSDYEDHTAHAFWAGQVLPLRMRPPS